MNKALNLFSPLRPANKNGNIRAKEVAREFLKVLLPPRESSTTTPI